MASSQTPDDPPSGDVVDAVVQTVTARLAELQPYLDEAERLRAILAASASPAPGSSDPDPAASASGQPSRRGAGANKSAILAVIADRPGVTAADIARVSGMKRTVVASTVSRLKRNGELEPEGRGVRLPRPAGDAAR
ncbi:MarR family transcriptional regulator [Patulibacter minatonensis]|uniref:MarR family transcriptional regulator n=1 Tax=Patulibacter minatonensis TaxID=298163 RepID=UPI0012FBCC46|nr:helix-turn-helix domain-containing protein [Patulibacter minatonensis]